MAAEGTDPANVYPNSIFLPETGIQRGTIYLGDGDPETPLWPSLPNVYRQTENLDDVIPDIPCQPIGYGDAKKILEL